MKTQTDFTSRSRRFAMQYPLLHSISVHIIYWVIAFLLLSFIISYSTQILIDAYPLQLNLKLGPFMLNSAIQGLIFGAGIGVLNYFLDKQIFRNKPLGLVILLRAVLSTVFLVICFLFRKYVLFGLITAPTLDDATILNSATIWRTFFYMTLIYVVVMSVILNFMREVNKKFGPGILLPLLFGKYRNPKEEERIFMFMDLKSSTTIAEALGHMRYSGFIRDAFKDINNILSQYDAEVYQYVGDEIVVCWKTEEGLKNFACVHFFFACEKEFAKRKDYYEYYYGLLPEFKASLHIGKVTAVEIGEVKRDLAYHGDTLNTAARIQGKCNEYQKKLLVSDIFHEAIKLGKIFKTQPLGSIMLKGKTIPVGIFSVEE
jgi:adenylate cyclase